MSDPARPALSVVVVTHDSGPTLLDCVERVLAQAPALELIVVDNGSRDGMPGRLPSDPRLRLLCNAGNPGFAVACNQGAAIARAEHLLFLNPDCLLPPGAAARLLTDLAAQPRVGLLGAQLLEADGRPQPAARRALPTVAGLFRRTGSGEIGALGALLRVEATSGALMLLPRSLFDALGGFDEGYVLHCEDLDLCRRVRAAGFEVAIDPGLEVVHVKGCSSGRRPFWVEWQKHRGMLRYLRRFERHGIGAWLYPLLACAVWLRFPLAAARAWWSARRRGGTLLSAGEARGRP